LALLLALWPALRHRCRRAGPDFFVVPPSSSGSQPPRLSSLPMGSTTPTSTAGPVTSRCRRRAASRAARPFRGCFRTFPWPAANRPVPPRPSRRRAMTCFPATPLAVFQEDADRARLLRQAERGCLYGLFRQAYRKLAEEFNSPRCRIMPWGAAEAAVQKFCDSIMSRFKS